MDPRAAGLGTAVGEMGMDGGKGLDDLVWRRGPVRASGGAAGVRVPVAVGLVGAALMAIRLLEPMPVGLANNGDASRLMCQIGANASGPPWASAQWHFVRLTYNRLPPQAGCFRYHSSQLIQLKFTTWIHHLIGLSGVIDVRELIVEDSLLAGGALGALAWLLRKVRIGYRLALIALFFLVLADTTFAVYAASPYSEPAAMIGVVVAALAGAAVIAKRDRKVFPYIILWAGSALAIGAKTETVSLLLPLGVLVGTQRLPIGRFAGRFGARVVPLVCAAALIPIAMWVNSGSPTALARTNVGDEITMTVMPLSHDPAQVAADLGMQASFGKYSGTNWWSPHPIWADPLYPTYADKLSRPNLAHYLIRHPGLDARILSSAAPSYFAMRPGNLGNYPIDSGHATAFVKECRVCIVTTIAQKFRDTGFAGIVAYWILCLAAAAWLWIKSARQSPRRGFTVAACVLVGVTACQYLTAAFGEGNEVTKHLAVGLLAASLTPVWLLAGTVAGRTAENNETPEHKGTLLIPHHRQSEPDRIIS